MWTKSKIPETNKDADGNYIARLYGGGCVPLQLIEKNGKQYKGWIKKYEYNGKIFYSVMFGRRFNASGFEIKKGEHDNKETNSKT